jgi:Tfp pilus assembly protein PilO
MPIAVLNISSAIGVPIKQGHIDFMTVQLDAYRRKAAKRPEFEHYVHEIEKEIEVMRRELGSQAEVTKALIDINCEKNGC